jgi:hypothetical protein
MFASRVEFCTQYVVNRKAVQAIRLDKPSLDVHVERKETIPDSINSLIMNGKFLGEGSFGKAFLIGKKVYKIFKNQYYDSVQVDEKKGEERVRLAKRSVKYWNKIYREIYDGKYAHLAIAEYRTIEGCDVLITPYIEGEEAALWKLPTTANYTRFREAMIKMSLGMYDWDTRGNLKIVGDDLLPVDMDAVYRCPSKKNRPKVSFFTVFKKDHNDEEPLSPASRHWYSISPYDPL